MKTIGVVWVIAYRNISAILMSIGLSILLVYALIQKENIPKLISRENVDAILIEMKTSTTKSAMKTKIILKLQLPGNRICKTSANVKLYQTIGDAIPVTLELYDNDSSMCFINYP